MDVGSDGRQEVSTCPGIRNSVSKAREGGAMFRQNLVMAVQI